MELTRFAYIYSRMRYYNRRRVIKIVLDEGKGRAPSRRFRRFRCQGAKRRAPSRRFLRFRRVRRERSDAPRRFRLRGRRLHGRLLHDPDVRSMKLR